MRIASFIVTALLTIANPALAENGVSARVGATLVGQGKALSPTVAGQRGGEAAGAALVCYGLRITKQGAELRSQFQGADLAEFDAQAGKVLEAWQLVKTCTHAGGPNECKVSQQWNCLMALREIGPQGSALPGLIEPK